MYHYHCVADTVAKPGANAIDSYLHFLAFLVEPTYYSAVLSHFFYEFMMNVQKFQDHEINLALHMFSHVYLK